MSLPQILGAMARGFRGRCPECGQGRLFRAYLKVQACDVCGHDNLQYPADDAPPYFTILIVGHVVIAPLLLFPFIWEWPMHWVMLTTLPALGAFTLWLLPRVKGAVIGLQWAIRAGEGKAPGQDDDQTWKAEG